jgi:hypothetical protein
MQFLADPDNSDTFERFAGFINRIRSGVDAGAVIDFEQLQELGDRHLNEGVEAVATMADNLALDANDLLVTLLYG